MMRFENMFSKMRRIQLQEPGCILTGENDVISPGRGDSRRPAAQTRHSPFRDREEEGSPVVTGGWIPNQTLLFKCVTLK